MALAPLCDCHSEPKVWKVDKRRKAGGTWHCRVRIAENAARYERSEKGQARKARHYEDDLAQKRERYDADPLYRIGKRLGDDARQRGLRHRRARVRFEAEYDPNPERKVAS